jgi:hypothetical protein
MSLGMMVDALKMFPRNKCNQGQGCWSAPTKLRLYFQFTPPTLEGWPVEGSCPATKSAVNFASTWKKSNAGAGSR